MMLEYRALGISVAYTSGIGDWGESCLVHLRGVRYGESDGMRISGCLVLCSMSLGHGSIHVLVIVDIHIDLCMNR
jgi:hypothetical protein